MRDGSLSKLEAFTLVEVMIIVALIGLLAALAVPAFVQARKQSQGKRNDAAINAWAIGTGKADDDAVDLAAAAQYTKSGVISASNIIGNSWVIRNVGTNQIEIYAATKGTLAGVAIDWGPY